MKCNICPRNCNIDRNKNTGFCLAKNEMVVSKIMLHHWEEPIISGDKNAVGSGAIFFAGCNLKCIYCQNFDISNSCVGKTITKQNLIDIFKDFEKKGALNINLVTPTHFTEQIIEALQCYKPSIPIVWNSSGYEKASEIKKLKDLVDIYLVDLKYMDSNLAQELSYAKDYPDVATQCILTMKQNQPVDIIDNGIMKKGVIVRHLVLPNCVNNSFLCFDWLKNNLGTSQIVSVMSQYVPCFKAKNNSKINRKLHKIEYKRVLGYIEKLGFNNGFLQEMESANNCYTPDFSKYED